MTPRRRRILTWTAATLTAMAGILLILPLDATLVTARAVALAAVAQLIWRYHRLADWESVPIGRSTMAIKGAILVIALAANARSINISSQLDLDTTAFDVGMHHGPLYAVAEIGIVLGWLCVAAALILRSKLVTELQRAGQAHHVPPAAQKRPRRTISHPASHAGEDPQKE